MGGSDLGLPANNFGCHDIFCPTPGGGGNSSYWFLSSIYFSVARFSGNFYLPPVFCLLTRRQWGLQPFSAYRGRLSFSSASPWSLTLLLDDLQSLCNWARTLFGEFKLNKLGSEPNPNRDSYITMRLLHRWIVCEVGHWFSRFVFITIATALPVRAALNEAWTERRTKFILFLKPRAPQPSLTVQTWTSEELLCFSSLIHLSVNQQFPMSWGLRGACEHMRRCRCVPAPLCVTGSGS